MDDVTKYNKVGNVLILKQIIFNLWT